MHVLITGVSSGLGKCLQEHFTAKNYRVTGTTHVYDEAHRDQFVYNAMYETAQKSLLYKMKVMELPPVDLLINNAGTNAIRHFEHLDLGFLEGVMRVNCHAPVMLVQELLTSKMFASQPDVINITSDAAWRPMRHSAAYNASKAAFDMMTRQMARELTKPNEMTIVGIRPGKMHSTHMSDYIEKEVMEMRGWTAEQARAYYVANSVTGYEADPRDVARFIYELWENPLFRTMSGACIDLVG